MLATTLVVLGCGDETSNTNAASTGPGSGGGGGTAATGGNGPGSGGSGAMGGSGGAGGTPVPQNQFLYVANQSDDTVSVFLGR